MKVKLLILFVVFFGGFLLGHFDFYFFGGKINTEEIIANAHKEGLDMARKELESRGVSKSLNNTAYTNELNGRIVKINDNEIIIKVLSSDLIPNSSLLERKVILTKNTVIKLLKMKNEEEYNIELSNYYKNNPDEKNNPAISDNFPSKMYSVKGGFSDLSTGQMVTTKADNNILNLDSFEISELVILGGE